MLSIAFHILKRQLIGKGANLDTQVDIQSGKLNYFLTGDEGRKDSFYDYFSGKQAGPGVITIDGKEPGPGEIPFIFLPDISAFKGIQQKALIYLLHESGKTKPAKKKGPGLEPVRDKNQKVWEILFNFAVQQDETVILLCDFFEGLAPSEMERIKEIIQENGLTCLYVGSRYHEAIAIADDMFYKKDDTTIDIINHTKKD